MTIYKTITMKLSDEEQVYVVESHVTAAHIAAGDAEGVICHMVDASKADLIVTKLNEHSRQDRKVA